MLYILNPGDGYDVLTRTSRAEAVAELSKLKDQGFKFARLYSYGALGAEVFCEYYMGEWGITETANLPIKVLEAARVWT